MVVFSSISQDRVSPEGPEPAQDPDQVKILPAVLHAVQIFVEGGMERRGAFWALIYIFDLIGIVPIFHGICTSGAPQKREINMPYVRGSDCQQCGVGCAAGCESKAIQEGPDTTTIDSAVCVEY